MRVLKVSMAALSACLVVWAASDPAAAARATTHRSCCRVRAGTTVEVELADQVSTKAQKTGDTFALRLAAPLIVDGKLVLRAGAGGVGDGLEASHPGMGGKAAKLVLEARYLTDGRRRVPLQGLQLAAAGRSSATEASAAGLMGIAFFPLGFVGLAVHGGDVVFPVGTRATAELATSVTLPSLGRASPSTIAAAAAATAPIPEGSITVPPPPPGKGQVVFFRRRTLLGTAQWFNVREGGRALGKLSNGAYFVDVTTPGTHTYTATEEPELKDHLELEVAPGETYFVEGILSKGVVLSAADLTPSSPTAFALASAHLKLAEPPKETEGASPAQSKPPPG